MTIKFKKITSFVDSTIYQASNGQRTLVLEVTKMGRDKIGDLKRVENSQIGMFESYTMKDIKSKVISFFIKSQSIKEKQNG